MAPQLTIFYSGTVNVYNNIPAEKAHAIMLLLGSCNGKKNSNDGSTGIEPLTSTTKITLGTLQPEKKPQLLCRRSQAELPYARKASLARFLEKRKDRIQETVAASASASAENGSEGPSSKKMKLSMEIPTPQ